MNDSKSSLLTTAGVVLSCFANGWICFVPIFNFLEPAIPDIRFAIQSSPGPLPTVALFACFMAFIPLTIVLVYTTGKIQSAFKRTGVIMIVLIFVAAAAYLRHTQVLHYFTRIVHPFLESHNRLPMDYPIDPRNIVYYMMTGLVLGSLLSLLIFRERVNISDQRPL